MDLGGFQSNVSNTSAPLNVGVGQTTPDVSVVVHGELPSMRGFNTQPPTFPADSSILDADGASGFFNPTVSADEEQLSPANVSMNLEEQSRLPVQCTSPNWSLDTLNRQAQRPAAQSCIETMLTPGSADQVLSQQGQLSFFTSADPASCSNSQNLAGFCHGEKQGHPGLLQQRNFAQLDNPMVSFPGSCHSKQPKNSVPNSQEMAEQGFTYHGDGIFKCDTCSIQLSTKLSPVPSDILKNHQQLCRRQYDTRQYHLPQEQMLPKTPDCAVVLFAKDEYGHSHVLRGPVKHPEYAAYEKRFISFLMMPSSVPKTPRELASAGFYFLREPDQVACFSCDVGFRNWEPDDDPCKEHARQSPNCTFVKQVLHSQSVQQPINGSSTTNQARTLATASTSTSFQPGTLATNGSSASIMTGNLATNGSIDYWQQLPIDSISHDVSNISLDVMPSLSGEINHQAIADMGYQPDQIRRAITQLNRKKYIGVIDTNRIVNEILEMDETKVTPRCFKCLQEMRGGYTLLPCGHVAICLNCDIRNILECPVCHGRVTGSVVTYPNIMH